VLETWLHDGLEPRIAKTDVEIIHLATINDLPFLVFSIAKEQQDNIFRQVEKNHGKYNFYSLSRPGNYLL
jgi:hypothetical protein